MLEIIENISFQEYCLTRNRVTILLNILGKEHKKDTTQEKLIISDFFLKFPELLSDEIKVGRFDIKYSYFHWKPNYKLYNAVLTDLLARNIITFNSLNNRYSITDKGEKFIIELFSEKGIDWSKILQSCDFIISNVLNKSISAGQMMIQSKLDCIRGN